MTTEPGPRPRPVRPRVDPDAGRDLRLYLITLLALVYLLAWWAFWLPAPIATSAATPDRAPTEPPVPTATPAAHRPAALDARPTPVRAPTRQRGRVRTRSS